MLCGGGGDVAENTLPHIEQSRRSASFKRVQTGHCRCSSVAVQGTSPTACIAPPPVAAKGRPRGPLQSAPEAKKAPEGVEIRPASSLSSDRFRFEPHPSGCFGKEVEMALRGGLGMMARARVPRLE